MPCSNIISTAALILSLIVGICVSIYYTVNPTLPGAQAYATGGLQPNALSDFEYAQVVGRTLVVFNLTAATLLSYVLIFFLVRFRCALCSARVLSYIFSLDSCTCSLRSGR